MARKPRVHCPGALYHVILRGNAGQTIFFDDRDRARFYLLLQEGTERFRHRIHAFCLMSNHVHLAIQVADLPLSRIIQNLSFRYTKWVNWRQSRSGHLFQGRYKAVLVDADAYLLELTRYIHLNPVEAGLVKEPEEHMGSHRAYLGLGDSWLTTVGFYLSLKREYLQPGGPMSDSFRKARKEATGRSTTRDPERTVGYSAMTNSLTESWRRRRRSPNDE
jgi:REP element-mobilizing transposase RayT